jgi:hypothetical protein
MVSSQILTKFISYLDGTTSYLANQTVLFLIGCHEILDFWVSGLIQQITYMFIMPDGQ